MVNALDRLRTEQFEPQAEDLVTRTPNRRRSEQFKSTHDVTIEGVENLMTTVAKCCQPIPGDPVIGYITRGRGVTIHLDDCRQVLRWRSVNNPVCYRSAGVKSLRPTIQSRSRLRPMIAGT